MKRTLYILLLACISLSACITKKNAHGHEHSHNAIDYTSEYTLKDDAYGTETQMKISGDQRIMTTNSLPNHNTGDFPNPNNPNTISEQNQTYSFPLVPKYIGQARPVKEPGVALNGVKFDPGTGERVECESGEMFRIEAIQDFEDLGLDFNNAHVQPSGHYHYHGIPKSLVENIESDGDLVHIGYAKDGFRIVYSKSLAYQPGYVLKTASRKGSNCSYRTPNGSVNKEIAGSTPDGSYTSDWEFKEGIGNLDECNGATIDGEYVYLVTEEYPFIGRCLMGEFKEERRGRGPRGGNGRQGPPPGGRGGRGN